MRVVTFFLFGTSIFGILGCQKNFLVNIPSEMNSNKAFVLNNSLSLQDPDWSFIYVDNFDSADNAIDYGLNDRLPSRQLYGSWKNTLWERREGGPGNRIVRPWYSQVNHQFSKNVLSFHSNQSAVMLKKNISSGPTGRFRVSFTTNPVKYDSSSVKWASFMLDSDSTAKGYVQQTKFGFAISASGNVGVFQNGNSKTITGNVSPADKYAVILDISPGQLIASINGSEITATLDESLPGDAFVFLGADIDSASSVVSTFDDLVINTPYAASGSHLKHYGYYWASSSTYGNHLAEVADYTNFNFVDKIASGLSNTKTNVLQVRWQFWADNSGTLRTDWLTQWNALLPSIQQNIDKIKALYIIDEPFWAAHVNVSDYNMVLDQVKSDLPDLPIIATFAYPTVNDLTETDISNTSDSLNWVAADRYVAVEDFDLVLTMMNNLSAKKPNNNVFLVPQTYFSGTTTDAEVAEINWMFYNAALANNKAIGLWNFGLWSNQQPSKLPLTLQVQKLIGNAIIHY